MATEDLTGSAKFIDDLVATNPVSSDSVSDGDDHIRGVKNVLKNTLPNITGAVTPTHTELNYVDGVTSAIQTQIDGKVDDAQVLTNVPSGALFTDTTYSHPTGDGNLHVPATSTTNNAKVLTAGSTAGSLSWETPSSGGGGASAIDDLTDAVGYTFVDGATTYESYGLGDGALSSVANGYSLVAVGDQSLASVESGHSNTAVGANALENLTFSSGNNALGSKALNGCSTGSRNNAFGYLALWRNSTGSANHAVGSECMKNNYTGSNNCGFGRESLQASTGDENTAYGNFSLQSTTGTKNIGIGYTAGDAIGTGSNNTIIGDLPGSSTLADTVLIGAGTTERLKVNSTGLYVNGTLQSGGGGYVLIETETVSGSPSTIEFTALETGTYNSYMLVAYNINSASTSSTSDLVFQVGTGASPTWESSNHLGHTENSYHYTGTYSAFAANDSSGGFRLMQDMYTGINGHVTIMMDGLGDTGVHHGFRALGAYGSGAGGNVRTLSFGGYFTNNTNAITGLRFKFAGGENFDDGIFKLYGIV
jgi:hypothetical protein